MANPFAIEPANPLAALMAGVQGYDRSRQNQRQGDQDAARRAAESSMLSGGDTRSALARLIGAGDVAGAKALADMELARQNQQWQQTYQGGMLDIARQNAGQTAQMNAAQIANMQEQRALQKRGLDISENEPKIVPFGAGLIKKSGETIQAPGETAALDDSTLNFMADQYLAGDTSVLTNLGRGAQGAANVVALRKKIAERNVAVGAGGADQANRNAEFFGTKAGQRTLGTRQANIELAATEFKQVLPVVVEASNAVNRTSYPDLNKIIQMAQEKTGDPNIVRFGGGINTLINLYARSISPSGMPTVSDKDHAREILQKAWSQGQFNAAVGMMQQEIDAALSSPEKVRDEMRRRFLGGQPSKTSKNLSDQTILGVDVQPVPSGPVDWKSYFPGAK